MVDINDDAKAGAYRLVEVVTGTGRRRKWSEEDKAPVVAQTLRPGTVLAGAARRRQFSSHQVFRWRREMRRAAVAPVNFVPIVAAKPMRAPEPALPLHSPTSVEVEVACAVLRVAPCTDGDLLMTVPRAIRASAACPNFA